MSKGKYESSSMQIATQYIKDISFEMPDPIGTINMAQQHKEKKPEVKIDVQVNARKIETNLPKKEELEKKDLYEVTICLKMKAYFDKHIIFILDFIQGSIVEISNSSEEQKENSCLTEVPHLMFPAMKHFVHYITAENNMPVILTGIDWKKMHENSKKNQVMNKDEIN